SESGSAGAGSISPPPERRSAPRAATTAESEYRSALSSAGASRLAPEQPLRPDEDHHHEEQERDRVAPFGRETRAADRDEFRDDEGRDEAAEHVAEAAEHADHEDERAELQADLRIDVELQHHQRCREAGEPAADRRRAQVDAALVDAHQRHDLTVLRDGADRYADVSARQKQP